MSFQPNSHAHVISPQMLSEKHAVRTPSSAVCRSAPPSCANFLEQNSLEQYESDQLGENPQSHSADIIHTLPDNSRELNIVSSLHPNQQSEETTAFSVFLWILRTQRRWLMLTWETAFTPHAGVCTGAAQCKPDVTATRGEMDESGNPPVLDSAVGEGSA